MLIIKQFIWNVVDSNSWLLIEKDHGLLIDVVDDEGLYNEISQLSDLKVVITHSHFDHIIGLNKLRKLKSDICVISTEKCSKYIGSIYRNMSSTATVFLQMYNSESTIEIKPFTCAPADKTFDNELEFEWEGHTVRLISVCGHSDDSLIALFDDSALFSGDTLLPYPTVTKFPKGSTEKFWKEDIPKIESLNAELVFPGHGKKDKLENMLSVNIRPEKYITSTPR